MTSAILAFVALGVAVIWSGHPLVGAWLIATVVTVGVSLRFCRAMAEYEGASRPQTRLQCERCRDYRQAEEMVWVDHTPVCGTCRREGHAIHLIGRDQ